MSKNTEPPKQSTENPLGCNDPKCDCCNYESEQSAEKRKMFQNLSIPRIDIDYLMERKRALIKRTINNLQLSGSFDIDDRLLKHTLGELFDDSMLALLDCNSRLFNNVQDHE